MSIIASELKWYKSATVTNGDGNGGIMSTVEIIDGVKNNIFPDVSQAERLAGMTGAPGVNGARYRKVFAKLTNATNYPDDLEVLINPAFHMKSYTPGEDWVEMFEGTQTDTQVGIDDSEQKYGAGYLLSPITAGATTFVLKLEDSSQTIHTATGNCVYLGSDTNQEYHTNVNASQSNDEVTFTLQTAGDVVANDYPITGNGTIVATVIYGSPTSLTPTFGTLIESGAGTYDDTTYPLLGDNIGSVEDTFTITFDNADNISFTCTDSSAAEVGTGNINTDFQPTNTDFSTPYFTLLSDGWGAGWLENDTLTIPTHPAAKGIWLKQTVPAGANSYSGDNFYLRFGGESA